MAKSYGNHPLWLELCIQMQVALILQVIPEPTVYRPRVRKERALYVERADSSGKGTGRNQ